MTIVTTATIGAIAGTRGAIIGTGAIVQVSMPAR